MPKVSIVVPACNTSKTIGETLKSLQQQTFTDFEVIIVDDGSTDTTQLAVAPFLKDPRFFLVVQPNRGLAGARNTGVLHSQGEYIGLCDSDDLWHPRKLTAHVAHLDMAGDVGLSYSGSEFIDDNSRRMRGRQSPRLHGVDAAHVFKRNPVGNGSAAVVRRAAFDAIAYTPRPGDKRLWFFDETFRQSEDIECWLRLALTTDWGVEGVSGHLTKYRVSSAGLSANTDRQLLSWERMVAKLRPVNPEFFERHEQAARAYQLRYLTRRAISARDRLQAGELAQRFMQTSRTPLTEEPIKTCVTLAAAALLSRTRWDPMQLVTRS